MTRPIWGTLKVKFTVRTNVYLYVIGLYNVMLIVVYGFACLFAWCPIVCYLILDDMHQ